MSNWADLLGDEPLPRDDMWAAVKQSGALVGIGEPESNPDPDPQDGVVTFTVGDANSEPPAHVVRLRLAKPDIRLEEAGRVELARVPRGEDEPSGWWWVEPGQSPDTTQGWLWDDGRTVTVTPILPTIADPEGPFAHSLATALPDDEEWYQIGTTMNGVPVWGQNSPDSFDIVVRHHSPDGS